MTTHPTTNQVADSETILATTPISSSIQNSLYSEGGDQPSSTDPSTEDCLSHLSPEDRYYLESTIITINPSAKATKPLVFATDSGWDLDPDCKIKISAWQARQAISYAQNSELSKANRLAGCRYFHSAKSECAHTTQDGRKHEIHVQANRCRIPWCPNCAMTLMRTYTFFSHRKEDFRVFQAGGKLFNFYLPFASPVSSPDEMRSRVESLWDAWSRWREILHKERGITVDDYGALASPVIDPAARSIILHMFYVGPELPLGWIRDSWSRATSTTGSTVRTSYDSILDPMPLIAQALSGMEPAIIRLNPEQLVQYDLAFTGCRLIKTVGTFHGPMDANDQDFSAATVAPDDPSLSQLFPEKEAPFGRCTCCNSPRTKPGNLPPMCITDYLKLYNKVLTRMEGIGALARRGINTSTTPPYSDNSRMWGSGHLYPPKQQLIQ